MKYVYSFGDSKADGKADMKNLLGGKGANLAEMNLLTSQSLPGLHLLQKYVLNIIITIRRSQID